MKRVVLLHPLLWAAFPVVFLYAHNLQELRLDSVLGPLALSVGAALVLTLAFAAVYRDLGRAAIAATLLLIGFFSYGHVYTWFEQTGLIRHRFLLPAWVAWMALGTLLIARSRRRFDRINRLAFTLAGVLICVSLAQIVAAGQVAERPNVPASVVARDPVVPPPPPDRALPDVYYILLDAYGGEESLARYFDFDNHQFLDGLERRGFFVAHRSRANYLITHLAMAASLNMTYVDSLTELAGTDSRNLHVLNALIRDNRVARILEKMGYEAVAIHSPADLSARDFPNLMLQTTMLSFWSSIEHHRRQTLEAFQAVEELPPSNRPRFVYAHVLCPHAPYVFGPHGEAVQGLEFKRALGGAAGRYQRYTDQVRFVNLRLNRIVTGILAKAKTPPIIVLQGDHGPLEGEDLEHLTPDLLGQRAPILNALLLPDGPDVLPDDLSPVNNFRVVLNRAFGAELPLLENETFYSHGKRPYRLTRVTDQVAPRAAAGPDAAATSRPRQVALRVPAGR